MVALKTIVSLVIGYILGSISFAVIMSKLAARKDIRKFGSGNAGATNVARVLGIEFGIFTFCGDVLKTVAAMLLGRLIGGETGFVLAGAGCLMGHTFPIFFGFRGGNGVTVGGAIAMMIDIRFFLILIGIFAVAVILSKIVSVGSLLCGLSYPFVMYALGERSHLRLALGVVVLIVVIFMHRSNIARLLKGEEKRFSAKKRDNKR